MNNIINFRTDFKEKSQELRYAVALGRVSDTRQRQKNVSIPAQKSRIEEWAQNNNVIILKWDKFDHSAFRDLDAETRFTELINHSIRDRRVSLFLVDEKSRFARDRYTRVVYEEKLRRAGVKLIGVNEPDYDRKSIHGVWMEGISIKRSNVS
ncbi:MAG: hypothetical protein VR69_17230 [Peptococcaceae bacterium BRH_c4b]|nr:MAG: hypothetical protein VR69_17230 [Peptococcaceae bacterium BRH_c4b]